MSTLDTEIQELEALTLRLRKQDRHIGRLQMLKQILLLTAPVRNLLPAAYVVAVMRLDANEDPDG